MDTLPRLFLAARFLVLGFAALLVSGAADAQTLSVTPTSVSVQANFGTNAPSQTVQVTKMGAGALRWTVVQAAAPWVTVSPASGTNNVALILTFQTSGLAVQAQPYTTSFRVVSGNQSVTVNVAVTIVAVTPPPPPTLTITCPANITVASPNGSPVAVNYTVTTSGGNPPVNLTVTPPSGSSFAVGPATTVQASAQSQDGQTKNCSFTVTLTFSPPSGNWTFCASEGQFCAFSGTQQVRYGANNTFFIQTLTGGTPCTNAVFGDPIPGVVKHCDVSTPPPTLTITCPANITVASPDGSPVVVTYTVTTSGGNPPVNLTVTPTSGSSFAVGPATTVQANAQSQDGQTKSCSFTVTVTAPSSDWTFCAQENQFCAFSGTQQVRYGANNTYFIQTLTGGTQCSNAVFGDPIFGTAKHCDISAPPPPPTLTITCPANITVASPDGSPVTVTYTVTTSGGNPPVNLTVTPQSGSSFAVGPATTVQANAQSQDGQTKSCSFTVTVTAPSSNWTFCAAENQFCAFSGAKQVRYGANNTFFVQTLTGGTQCSNAVFGDPIPGVVKHCDVNSTAQVPGIGPQTAITCPAGAADILPGQSIQLIINANVAGTTFCLRASNGGVHHLTSSLRPKTGNTFVGEFGAIIDGTGWTTTERTQAAFRVYDDPNDPNDPTDPVNDVTIRNLVIRNLPQWAIYASSQLTNHWTIDHNEIASNKWGMLFGPNFGVTNNYIHHNVGNSDSSIPDDRGGGYLGDLASNTTFDSNEIAYNGKEQKVGRSSNVKFTNNFVHHNVGDGIWYDSNPNAAAVIDNNRVEDNGRNGIFFEASIGATISNNAIRRHTGWDGMFISMSQNAQIFNNTIEGNFGGIDFYLNCDALAADDIKNNTAHDNTVTVGTLADGYASGFFSTFSCTSTQLAPYLSGSKNLIFSHNTYHVPSLSFTRYFYWSGYKDWGQWQAVPQDATGTITTP